MTMLIAGLAIFLAIIGVALILVIHNISRNVLRLKSFAIVFGILLVASAPSTLITLGLTQIGAIHP